MLLYNMCVIFEKRLSVYTRSTFTTPWKTRSACTPLYWRHTDHSVDSKPRTPRGTYTGKQGFI